MSTILLRSNADSFLNIEKEFAFYVSILAFIWVFVLAWIMSRVFPFYNPNINQKKDADSHDQLLFLNKDIRSKGLEYFVKKYCNEINSYESIVKLLYNENLKLSYIRDTKMLNVKISVALTVILTFSFLFLVLLNV